MPYSSNNGKRATTRFLKYFDQRIGIRSFLDVGAGSGTYSDLYRKMFRSYKDAQGDKGVRWDAVEVWQPYIAGFKLYEKYDNVYVADARTMFNEGENLSSVKPLTYSIAFLGDVLEHMQKEEAIKLVAEVVDRAHVTIVSIPIVHYPQGEFMGNPYEVHVKDDWSHTEVMESFPGIRASHIEGEIGVYVIPNPLVATLTLDYEKALNGPFISAYGIFKNEEKFIERFLDKAFIAGFDELVLCDTGSTDNTKALINGWQPSNVARLLNAAGFKRLLVKEISVQPWRFDEARNAAMAFCDPNADLCVSIDIDEYVDKLFVDRLGWEWRYKGGAFTRVIHKFKTFWSEDPNNYSEHYHERIHARHGYRWALPVHEILEKYDGHENVHWVPDIFMFQKPDTTKARSSYFDLLKISVEERPDIWKSWSFLAGEYSMRGDVNGATECIQKALAIEGADKSYLHYQLASFMPGTDQALSELKMACVLNSCRELYVYLADEYFRQKQYRSAAMWMEEAAQIVNQTSGYMYNQNCWNENFDSKLKLYGDAAK